jgi:capsular exopolysaccharide synthesis family protein
MVGKNQEGMEDMSLNLLGCTTQNRPSESASRPGTQTFERIEIHTNKKYPLLLRGLNGQGSESFAILRARLLSMCEARKICSIVFTSAEKGEGKTLVTANLGLCLGELRRFRVLLVDGDLRLRSLSRLFGLEDTPGLSDVLAGAAFSDQVIRRTSLDSLSFLPAGLAAEETLTGLLQNGRWRALLERLKSEYDLVLIDCVPANVPVADFELMLPAVDGVVLVVHIRKTHRDSLQSATTMIPREKLLGLVINNSGRPRRYMYTYYTGAKR